MAEFLILNIDPVQNVLIERNDIIEAQDNGYWTAPKNMPFNKDVFCVVVIPFIPFESTKQYMEVSRNAQGKLIKKRAWKADLTGLNFANNIAFVNTINEANLLVVRKG